MTGRGFHRGGTLVLSLVMAGLGVAFLVEAVVASGSVASHLLLGVLFVAAGVGRLVFERKRGPRS
jgi:hypothetical protein